MSAQQVTRTGGLSVSQTLKELNRQRRIRRMRRVVISSSEATREHLSAGGGRFEALFVTLTYAPSTQWASEHIASYLRSVRKFTDRQGFRARYQWVIELTQRGVPHYHVLFWVPYGERLPKPDASGMWPHGFSQIAKARNAVGYLVKYATKGETDLYALPKHCRLFGVGGGSDAEKLATHRAGLPIWLSSLLQSGARARKISYVGWVCRATGEIFVSPFVVAWGRDDWGIVVLTITRKEIFA